MEQTASENSVTKRCLLVVNALCGNANGVTKNKKLLNKLRSLYDVVDEAQIACENGFFDIASACKGYDALCVSGGDGTLNSAINAIRGSDIGLLYYPCGTVNDFARSFKSVRKQKGGAEVLDGQAVDLGEFNGLLFSYIAAAGTLTPIGYAPKPRRKKFFKRSAYWLSAIARFRLHEIKARIVASGKVYMDTYTLIMAVKSKCAFGFNFNKRYEHNSGKGHLLLIKTPAGAFRLWKLFCRLFRAFFIGFRKEKDSDSIKFFEFSDLAIEFDAEQDFCIDGEKHVSLKQNSIRIHKEKLNISII